MLSVTDKRKNERKAITYATDEGDKPDPPAVAEEMFEFLVICPLCKRRVFDASGLSGNPVRLRLKCPHCRNIVIIPISEKPQLTNILR